MSFAELNTNIYSTTVHLKCLAGESSLHFAVVNGSLESVKLLVEKGANVNQRATGRFFLPEDQKSTPRSATTNYVGALKNPI